MDNEKLKEVYKYFRLSSYRDGDYILQDEYEELEEIIKNNKIVRYLEEIRYNYIRGIVTEEEYNNICVECVLKLKMNNN